MRPLEANNEAMALASNRSHAAESIFTASCNAIGRFSKMAGASAVAPPLFLMTISMLPPGATAPANGITVV